MKKAILWLIAAALLLSGCQSRPTQNRYPLDEVTQTMEAAVEEGHLFFAGTVLSVGTTSKMISYYDAEVENNTVYQVSVTEDFLGVLPQEPITVCIYGTKSNFGDRATLEKGKEYLFDTTLWVHGDEVVYLLPTFYQSLPQRQEETLFYIKNGVQAAVDGNFADYKEILYTLVQAKGYTPQLLQNKLVGQLQQAAARDSAYFAKESIPVTDEAHLAQTVATANTLLTRMEKTTPNWQGIGEVLSK